IRRKQPKMHLLVIHTAPDLLPDDAAASRVRTANQSLIDTAWGKDLPLLSINLSDPDTADLGPLSAHLAETLPLVMAYLAHWAERAEVAIFQCNRSFVLRYAGIASAGSALPFGGLSVPAIQTKMLSDLAQAYGVDWNMKRLFELGAALG